jgi:diguanylate cyclase (GGDEF)-like protein
VSLHAIFIPIISSHVQILDFSTAPIEIQRQALLDLVQRARGGLPIHLILWLLVGAMGGLVEHTPVFFWCAACGFGASLVCRATFEPRIRRLSSSQPQALRTVFLFLLLANPAIWGLISAAAVLWPPSALASGWLWMVVTGVAAAGGTSLAFDPVVRRAYAPFAVLPPAAVMLYVGSGEHPFTPIAAVVFLIYIHGASNVVHGDYWAAVQAKLELEYRAKQLEHMSATDALTQLPNRMHFDRQLAAEWACARLAATAQSALTVIMIDIDHFKKVNDSYGHPFGDLCLQSVAAALQSALVRPGDLLARFGGEEFVAMLPNTDAVGAAVVSARMQAAIAAMSIGFPGGAVKLTCSMGVHTADTRSTSGPSAAINNADQALYQAKRGGRNRVAVL